MGQIHPGAEQMLLVLFLPGQRNRMAAWLGGRWPTHEASLLFGEDAPPADRCGVRGIRRPPTKTPALGWRRTAASAAAASHSRPAAQTKRPEMPGHRATRVTFEAPDTVGATGWRNDPWAPSAGPMSTSIPHHGPGV